MRLYTIGYEGATLAEFIETLQRHRVKLVADLRKNPVSRKKGFSKRLLGEGLKAHEIEYLHLPGLGTPTEWRKQAKAGLITREKMFRDYEKKVLPKRPEELELLRKRMRQRGLALLCYEADASDCHRSYVAQKLAQLEKEKVRIINIHIPQRGGKDVSLSAKDSLDLAGNPRSRTSSS